MGTIQFYLHLIFYHDVLYHAEELSYLGQYGMVKALNGM